MSDFGYEDNLFHRDAISAMNDYLFDSVVNRYNINSDEMKIVVELDETKEVEYDEGQDHKYDKTKKKRRKVTGFTLKDPEIAITYFIKSKDCYFYDGQGVKRSNFPLKIKKTVPAMYEKKVLHLVEELKSVKYPEDDSMSFHQFFDNWFPIKHTSPDDKMVAKFCVLTNMLTNSFCSLSTPPGFGKDGMAEAILLLTNFGRSISGGSDAKIAQLLDNRYTVFNEVVGINKQVANDLNKFFKGVGAGQKYYEHTTTGSSQTKSRYKIGDYGFTVFFNLHEELMANGRLTWEEQYEPAVFDRVFPVLLKGNVSSDNQYVGVKGIVWQDYVIQNIDYYKKFIGRFFYELKDIKNFSLKFDIKKYNLSYSSKDALRWVSNFHKIGIVVNKYVWSKYPNDMKKQEQEFYEIMDKIYDRNRQYVDKVKNLNLIIDE